MATRKVTPVTCRRIVVGIEAYTRQHGRKPAVLILHPRQLPALDFGTYGRLAQLANIRILTSPLFDEPALANEKGEPFDV